MAYQPDADAGPALMDRDVLNPKPVRILTSDEPSEVLRFAVEAHKDANVAVATLVDVRGGAARAIGSHVVVAADGRFCGYVSGGCVEAAIASEALLALAAGEDRTVQFGDGSRFFDIVLPCGGGITVLIHVVKDIAPLRGVLDCLAARRNAALQYSTREQILEQAQPPWRSAWIDGRFVSVYRPRTRVLISGQSLEAQTVAAFARTARYDVVLDGADGDLRNLVDGADGFTALALLHHDLDAEERLLSRALRSPMFYIGALGSTLTHQRRVERLRKQGFSSDSINRIKAPIGIFGPTRDSTSLAISVLADIAASRLVVLG